MKNDNPWSKVKIDPKVEVDLTQPIIEPPHVDVGNAGYPIHKEDQHE